MPEGHSLHRLARDQQELVGAVVRASSPQGRIDASVVDGRPVEAVEAYGKHLLQRFGADATVHVHLGMRGIYLRSPAPPPAPKPQVRLRLEGAAVAWDLIAPSACELLDDDGVAALVGRLGPDPLRPDADPERAWEALASDARPLGTVLLDQAVLAGVGNVFRAEALHAERLHPGRPASSLGREAFDRLWATLTAMMGRAVDEGRIVTRGEDGRSVYKQERCADCGSPVETSEVGGRTAYVCPACQPAA